MASAPPDSRTTTLVVPVSAAGQRLDRWLADQFSDVSRSGVQRWIAAGLVLIDGQPPNKSGQALESGAEVSVQVPQPVETALQPEDIPLTIVFENPDLLVIDKPAGLVVHPGPGHRSGTLANAVLHHCPDLAGVGGEKRPGIVHRLDKGTSGLIVVAKNDPAMQALQEQFANRTVYKEYLALLEGRIEPPRGRIDAPIGRHPVHRQRMAVLREDAGRSAITDYETIRVLEGRTKGGETVRFSYVRAVLHTGRTHQIRVHFAWRQHPLVGDTDYGYRRPRLGLTRPFLHAHRLGFRLPGTGEERVFEAALPGDLQSILDQFSRA